MERSKKMAKGTLAAANIGDTFDCGSRIITGTELDMFCTIGGLRLDPFLIDAAAQAMGVKGRIVPGPFLITVVFGQAGDLLKGHLHVATDKVKVLSPVFPNDRIGVEIEILDNKEASKGRVFTTWGFKMKNQDGVMVLQGENTCMHQES